MGRLINEEATQDTLKMYQKMLNMLTKVINGLTDIIISEHNETIEIPSKTEEFAIEFEKEMATFIPPRVHEENVEMDKEVKEEIEITKEIEKKFEFDKDITF